MTEGVDVREFVEVAGVVSAATVAALGEAATDKADVVVVEADDFVAASRSRICFSTWNRQSYLNNLKNKSNFFCTIVEKLELNLLFFFFLTSV